MIVPIVCVKNVAVNLFLNAGTEKKKLQRTHPKQSQIQLFDRPTEETSSIFERVGTNVVVKRLLLLTVSSSLSGTVWV